MIFLAPTKAIIHFVGIVAITAGLPNDPGLHAVLPRIPAKQPIEIAHRHVEIHQAAIVFRGTDLLEASNWKPQELGNGFQYVPLNGELVTVAGSQPSQAAPPASLPSLKDLCHGTNLTQDFYFPYSGAAAVVTIPMGTVSACNPPVIGDPISRPRIDTEVAVDAGKTLVISGITPATKLKSVTRTLTFRANGESPLGIAIVNLPPRYLFGDQSQVQPSDPDGLFHYHAYRAMVATTANCDRPSTNNVGVCQVTDLPSLTVTNTSGANPGKDAAFNFQCSNSQWP
jgi:hypothetical protein